MAAVDILMAVKDGEAFLPATLESLRAQTMPDYRLVVVDDGSTDQTPHILRAASSQDPRLHVVRNEQCLGVAGALNRGLAECQAPLVARADADDLCEPERLAKQRMRMEEEPALGVLGSGYHRIRDDGSLIATVSPPMGNAFIQFHQLFMNAFLHSAVMFRTETVRSVGGYDDAYWTAQDSDLWCRIGRRVRMDNLAEPLVSYRVHDASVTKKRGEAGARLSLSVPVRALSAYLTQTLNERQVEPAVRLYQGFETLTGEQLKRAMPILAAVRRTARHELPEVQTVFRERIASNLMNQARRAGPRDFRRAALAGRMLLRWQARPNRPAPPSRSTVA